jgi:glutamate synthase (ferredoxin)
MYPRGASRQKSRHPNWGHPDHDACGTGFVARLGSPASHEIIQIALTALERLTHRGGVDADGASGDGAGLLTSLPHDFFRARAKEQGIELPEMFGLGVAFLPAGTVAESKAAIQSAAETERLRILGWRRVPVNSNALGRRALETMPEIWQFFAAPFHVGRGDTRFEWRLALLRKRAENQLPERCYICSLSSQMVVYKGLLTPWQFPQFYEDLRDDSFATTYAIFHQRYSTNTQPSWHLAQPFRHVAHNGEINTIVSNRRWLRAKEQELRKRLAVGAWFQPLEVNVSDSASFDNAFELKLLEGLTPEEAMLAMVPPAFENDPLLSRDIRAALTRLSQQSEPWDGPAALIFSNGQFVGAKLDRNGLRPLRYTLTHDGLLIAGSETGLVDLEEARIAERHRLGPGEMMLADPATGAFLRWREILKRLAMHQGKTPVAAMRHLSAPTAAGAASVGADMKRIAGAAGWTEDQFKTLFSALAHGKEADWSMGDDAPPAFLSALPRTLWDYCKQRFAQVTNPPIDPLRETHVMSLETHLKNGVMLSSPVLSCSQLAELAEIFDPVLRVEMTWPSALGVPGARRAVAQLSSTPLSSGGRPGLLLLSDRGIHGEKAALPALLATAAVWKAMVREGLADVPLAVESAQIFDTHHVALLIAAGATAVVPYLAEEFAEGVEAGGAAHMRMAINAGLRKVLARMGVSTLASYRNSHLFEIVGLSEEVCSSFFEDAADYPGAKTLDELLGDYLRMHMAAFTNVTAELADAGLYRFRKGAELHATSPEVVRRLHAHVKAPDAGKYSAFDELAEHEGPVFLRDLLETVPGTPVPVDEVESANEILGRFSTQAMSLGSLSPEAHRTLAVAMNQIGARSNTGEGGEDPNTYRFEPAAANKIKQVASGRFGVTADYLVHAEELEIKMAQGSKPGEGGQLPARKVTEYIARIRHATPGTPLISPPPHHDIYSIEDLAQLIHDLRAVNPGARIGVKLVSGAGVGIIAAGVAKAGADVITISGHNGGTGSSPLTSIKNTGLPWEIGLREAHDTLVRAGLRSRVALRVDGGLKFARDILVGALFGADEFGFGTAALLAIGCVMARQCHLNTCPVGIATQDEKLRTRFTGKPEMVVAYFRALAEEVRNRLAQMGARSLGELTGWYDRLSARSGVDPLLIVPISESLRVAPQQSPALYAAAREDALRFTASYDALPGPQPIQNSDRSVGAGMSGEWMRRRSAGNPPDTKTEEVAKEFHGSAGQSFGAFLAEGITLRLNGEANDYVGKGLSGGTIAIAAGAAASRRGDVLVGNTVLYGATSGSLFVAGRAGERFGVRNSGALAVVEGVGQHGCEYMTGGVVLVLGPCGLNFGSGMTGGLSYVLRGEADEVLHRDFVAFAEVTGDEENWLRRVLEEHAHFTHSPRAARILSRRGAFPLLRIQPVHFQGTVAATWEPILAGLSRSRGEIILSTSPAQSAAVSQAAFSV